MEIPIYNQPSPWPSLLANSALFSNPLVPENHVNWTQTPESHIYSADLPGVRKEEIKVELEDSRYLIIRTEAIDESTQPAKTFNRKFRIPGGIDIEGISAGLEDGDLTITVPRAFRSRRFFFIDPEDAPERLEVIARLLEITCCLGTENHWSVIDWLVGEKLDLASHLMKFVDKYLLSNVSSEDVGSALFFLIMVSFSII